MIVYFSHGRSIKKALEEYKENKHPGTISVHHKQKSELMKLEKKLQETEILQLKYVNLKENYKKLKVYYKLSMEGYQNEMNQMKNQLEIYKSKL